MAADGRNAIVDAVIARMQTITVANGYATDAGLNVSRWRSAVVTPAECPAIDVRDPDRRPAGVYSSGANQIRDYELAVEISVFASSGTDTDGELNLVMNDVMRAMMDGDISWGAVALNTRFDGDRKGIDQRESRVGMAVLRYLITYRT